MIVVLVVCVAFCLGSKLSCIGYGSGDGNMYSSAVEVHLGCFKFHQSNLNKKKVLFVIMGFIVHFVFFF